MSPMKLFWAVALSLLVILGITLAQLLSTRDPLPAQARRILAADPRFADVTVRIAFDDIVVLEGRTLTHDDKADAALLLWTRWTKGPRPSGILNYIRPDAPVDPRADRLFSPDVIPKIVLDKHGRPCTPGGALITHSPLMVIPSCDP